MALLLDVFHHHLIGHISRAGRKIAPSPKMPSPKLTIQRLELHQNLTRGSSLNRLEQLADGNVRWKRYENVNMIPGNVSFENFNVFGLTNLSHQLPQPRSYFACQNRLALLGNPNQMIL